MSIISVELRSLYRAIGELAYALATQDARVTSLEKLVFREAAKEELGKDAWVAEDSFNNMVNLPQTQHLTIEQTYNKTLFTIKQHQTVFSEDLCERFVSLLEKVGGVSGITEVEQLWIERFREDAYKFVNIP
jgi:hypothetical protein